MGDYAMTVEVHPGYLHATARGERTAANARRFLEEAYRACVRLQHDALLVEVRFDGPGLPPGSVFSVINDRAMDGARLRRIAYVEPNLRDAGQASFAELVAVNRGVNVRLFGDVDAAREWLNAGSPHGRGP